MDAGSNNPALGTRQLIIRPGYATTMCNLWLAYAEAFRNKLLTGMELTAWVEDRYSHLASIPPSISVESLLHRCSRTLIAIARHYRFAGRPSLKVELLEGVTHPDPFLVKRENWRDLCLFVMCVRGIAESEAEECRLGAAYLPASSTLRPQKRPLPPVDAARVVRELYETCAHIDIQLALDLDRAKYWDRARRVVRDAVLSDLGPMGAPSDGGGVASPSLSGWEDHAAVDDDPWDDVLDRLRSEMEGGGTAVEQLGRLVEMIHVIVGCRSSFPDPPDLDGDGLDKWDAAFDVMPDDEVEFFLRELRRWLPSPKTVERILAEYGSMGGGGDASQAESAGGPGASAGPRADGGRTPRRRGRPADTDPEADRRVAELMQQYRSREAVADLLKMSVREVKLATDRHKVRR